MSEVKASGPEPKGFNVQGHELRCDSCLGNTANVKNLLEKGAPVDYNHNDGHTSLHMAAGKGYTDIIMLLIEHKASLNIKNSIGDTPLITAALFDGMASVRALVEAGADMKVRGRHNKTAVEHAKAKGKSIIVKYLTSEAPLVQARLNAERDRQKRAFGQALLEASRWYTKTAEVKKLLEKGAPVDWQNEVGQAPLHWASLSGNVGIVMLLIEHKADLNITDNQRNTPLILAVASLRYSTSDQNQMAVVRALVQAGADITTKGSLQMTAIEMAKRQGNDSVAEYLATKVRDAKRSRDEMELKRQQNLQKEKKLASEQHSDIMFYLSINVCVASALIGWACYSR